MPLKGILFLLLPNNSPIPPEARIQSGAKLISVCLSLSHLCAQLFGIKSYYRFYVISLKYSFYRIDRGMVRGQGRACAVSQVELWHFIPVEHRAFTEAYKLKDVSRYGDYYAPPSRPEGPRRCRGNAGGALVFSSLLWLLYALGVYLPRNSPWKIRIQ